MSSPNFPASPSSSTAISFFSKLRSRCLSSNTHLCIGLDPHRAELTVSPLASDSEVADAAFTFCKNLIDKTLPYAACYKPNAAFFECLGSAGHDTLLRVIQSIPDEVPVLLDSKRGDIGTTANAYAVASYEKLGAHGVTLSPLMGYDSIEPFITGFYANKGGAFLLCKTSNPGSEEILGGTFNGTEQTVYEHIAKLACTWVKRAAQGNSTTLGHDSVIPPCLGLVVGSTDVVALAKARAAAPYLWILAPGVGAQGGDLAAACEAGFTDAGSALLIPVSRGISKAADPAQAALELRDMINTARDLKIANANAKLASSSSSTNNTTDIVAIADFQRDFIKFALDQEVLKFGTFTLKSGRTSPYFFNAGLFASGSALHKLGKAYASSIMASELNVNGKLKFDVIFGPAYKGISLGAVVAAALYSGFNVDVGFAYNRKEAKDHGEGGMLVGASMSGKNVLILDDVISAGTAIRESFDLLIANGAVPVGVAIALDRAEKRSLEDPVSAVQAVARDLRIPVVSIVSLKQLFGFLQNESGFDKLILEQVTKYREEYGVD